MKTSVNALIWFNFFVWWGLVAGFLFPVMSIVLYIVLSAVTLASRGITEFLMWSMIVIKFIPDFFVQNASITILWMISIFVITKVFNIAGNAFVFNSIVKDKSFSKNVVVRPNSESHYFVSPDGWSLAFSVNGDHVSMEPDSAGPTHSITSRIIFDMFEARCDKTKVNITRDSDLIRQEVGWAVKIWAFLFL